MVLVIACTLSLIAGFVGGWLASDKPPQYDRAKRMTSLIDELGRSPERQQRALDEIAKDGDGAYVYLLQHLNDQRPVASEYVQFLSTHPGRPEKYSLI